jgi:hypothetical protein
MPKSIVTRGMYVAFFFLAAVAMYILNFWSYKLLSFVPLLDNVCQHDDQWYIRPPRLLHGHVATRHTTAHGTTHGG